MKEKSNVQALLICPIDNVPLRLWEVGNTVFMSGIQMNAKLFNSSYNHDTNTKVLN